MAPRLLVRGVGRDDPDPRRGHEADPADPIRRGDRMVGRGDPCRRPDRGVVPVDLPGWGGDRAARPSHPVRPASCRHLPARIAAERPPRRPPATLQIVCACVFLLEPGDVRDGNPHFNLDKPPSRPKVSADRRNSPRSFREVRRLRHLRILGCKERQAVRRLPQKVTVRARTAAAAPPRPTAPRTR